MIQVVNRAMDILEYIARNNNQEPSLSVIANYLSLNHGTCANILKTLVNRNYVEQIGRKKGYRLGPMAYYLTGNYSYRNELLSAAKIPIEELTHSINEGAILAILKDNLRVIIHEVKANHELQVMNLVERNVYMTSTGRLLIAYLNDQERQFFVEKYGLPKREIWPEVEDTQDFFAQLDKIKREGMAFQTSASHVTGVSVPIWKNEKVIASLGVYLPEMRFSGELREIIIERLLQTSQIINSNLNTQQN
ncbi:IclR family transcriptional regulator C-terminal domain-containing protein [Rapidithrix thailandica]|uniref:IclR family transcriptional regulator C-terminal domain-containing protein n=1 Tax=Rapidithrix thailandica TaxID=413964 RepID=A0AAW9RP02_9BACT